MKEFLRNYLKYVKSGNLETGDFGGPVVTISRQTGCSARRIAIKLSKILTGYSYMSDTKTDKEWLWADKETFRQTIREVEEELTARNINNPEMLDRLQMISKAFTKEKFEGEIDENALIILKDVLVKLAIQGRYIILGRGATNLLADLPNKLSIRLEAPLEWRINRVAQMKNLSHLEAEEYILKSDEKRNKFTESVIGRRYDNTDFDIIFNYASLSDDQIVEVIVNILKSKKIISFGDEYY
ncbi:MAG: cytidylate kinase-like family protein [Prolixibacteraceae bacterium]|jgi:cytidylate kinase|nr:cytidylate kinase-like family protein [Prolixibacteraceae bacterium]NLX27886.1 cytidylate kinase-like family protein [Bacteroidales bacterium]HNQ37041.1 cytidylate kinase-like family protein [Prolixibacteraceae bacterium]HPJ77623.1 cytidylate kinase-like family protein [Prolixibacteraceae bacterium]HRV88165.1 cytidylate kinase-like family protein [Prolixibacteraceae bacterium]